LSSNAKDVEEMIQACKKANVLFMDGVMWSHHKRTKAIRDDLHYKKIGDLVRINSIFCADSKDGNIRLDPSLEPLGALGDLGWYNIRAILFGFNEELPERVYGITINSPNGVILTFIAQLWYSRGRTAQFTCSFETNFFQVVHFHGTTGTLILPNFVWPYDGQNTYTIENVVNFKNQISSFLVPEEGKPHNNYGLIEEFAKLVLEIKQGKPRNTYWEELALKNQKILDALLKSANEKREITL